MERPWLDAGQPVRGRLRVRGMDVVKAAGYSMKAICDPMTRRLVLPGEPAPLPAAMRPSRRHRSSVVAHGRASWRARITAIGVLIFIGLGPLHAEASLQLLSSTVNAGELLPSTATIGLYFSAPIELPPEAKSFALVSAGADTRALKTSDVDQVFVQGANIFITPRPPLHQGRSYVLTVPQDSLLGLSGPATVTFDVQAEDERRPVPLIISPGSDLQSKLSLDSQAPSVQFSETVTAVAGRKVTFNPPSGSPIYSIDAADAICGTGGTAADACIKIDDSGSKVSFFPRGLLEGVGTTHPASWVTPGATYRVSLEAGAFTDATRPEAVARTTELLEFDIAVSIDVDGPQVLQGVPAPTNLDPKARSVFLTFNERVQAGDSGISILAWNYAGQEPPSLLAVEPAMLKRDSRQTVVLSFDTTVQGGLGSHNFEVYNANDMTKVFEVPMQSALFVGSMVFLSPQASLLPATDLAFIVRTSSPDSILSSDFSVAMRQQVDMQGAIVTASSSSSGPALLWSSTDEYTCLPGNSTLPNITLYMSQALSSIDVTKVAKLYDCSLQACDQPGAVAGTPLWTLRSRRGELAMDVNESWQFKVTLGTDNLPNGMTGSRSKPLGEFRRYRLVLEGGMFLGAEPTGASSALVSIEFSTCQVEYDTPASSLVRVYSPKAFAASAISGARRFRVQLSRDSVKDLWGNLPTGPQTYDFAHEAEPPVIDPLASNPKNGQFASPFENVVLTFSEVVQLGSGKVEFWAVGAGSPSFNVDVTTIASASVREHNAVVGRHVSITPKTLCDGSPACGDLVVGTTYYVKTSTDGVFKDVIGNRLPQTSTQATWSWTVAAQDDKAPEFIFLAGYELLPPTGVYPFQLVGYIYFTERITKNAENAGSVALQDCGKDFDCAAEADNLPSYLPAELSFGEGLSRGGADSYGLLKFSRYLTKVPRRYKLILYPSVVVDAGLNGGPGLNPGPSTRNTLEIDVGQMPPAIPLDSVAPHLATKTPSNTQTGVAANTQLLLNFNEDVVRGSGLLQLCLNSDAEVDGMPACIPGRFADGLQAQADINSAVMDWRQATLTLPTPLAFRQTLYVLMPSGFVMDGSGNPSRKVEGTVYSFSVTEGDDVEPTLDYYSLPVGATGGLRLHFSEAMQLGSGVNVVELDGARDTNVTNLVTTIEQSMVTVHAKWQTGAQYRLDLSSDAFMDLSGNVLAVNLTTLSDSYTFQVVSTETVLAPADFSSTGPLRILTSQPSNGSVQVVPSSSFKVVFSSAVQAGIGTISFGSTVMSIQDCTFVGNSMICDPPGYFDQNSNYEVRFPATAVKDSAGNALSWGMDSGIVSFTFTTIDIDLIPPLLMTVSTGAPPFESMQDLLHLSRGPVLSLSFSETVQAGEGMVLVSDCSPGNPSLCNGEVGENVQDSLLDIVHIQSGTPNADLFFSSSTVYVACPLLTAGTKYSVRTSKHGTFLDSAQNPFAQIVSGVEFAVVPADTTAPTVLAYAPKNNSVGDVASNADIRLYFSEAVQAVTGAEKLITVSTISASKTFAATLSSTVKVYGSMVVIDPYFDMPDGADVTLTIAAGSFADFAGNAYAGINSAAPYKWQSAAPTFNKAGATLPPRHGMAVHALSSGLMMYGGRRDSGCLAETYTSADKGATWTSQVASSSNPAIPPPAVAYPATAEAADCVWLLGGQCSGNGTAVLWKTCTAGTVWDPLPAPVSSVPGILWPSTFSSVVMAIVGGWQLVVLDLSRGHCWLFLDRQASQVVRTTDQLPFAPRRNAALLVSSSNDLFLVGGDDCLNDACSDLRYYMDVWKSAASAYVGRHWTSLTANYGASLPAVDMAAMGRRDLGIVMTRDDTIYLLGGRSPDGLRSFATVFASEPGLPDKSFEASPQLMVPLSSGVVLVPDTVSIYFKESIIILDASLIRLVDLGQDDSIGGSGVNADSDVAFGKSAVRQVLRISSGNSQKLTAGRAYQVLIADGAIADAAGNIINSFVPQTFATNPDATPPLITMPVPAGQDAVPWTTFVLEANEDITIGSGSLDLSCAVGSQFKLPVSGAEIRGRRAVFRLRSSQFLTDGQAYVLKVPAGLLQDLAGNKVVETSFTFSVLSGVATLRHEHYFAEGLVMVVPEPGNPLDTTKPALESVIPAFGATDVPTDGVAVVVRYSEQVKLHKNVLVALSLSTANATITLKVFNENSTEISVITNGVRIALPTLSAGSTYTLSIPDGAVIDTAGNLAPAVSTGFVCLRGLLDKAPPLLTMTDPANVAHGAPDWGSGVQIGTVVQVSAWFSEPIAKGSGNIIIQHIRPEPLSSPVQVPVNSSTVTIFGAMMSITLASGALSKAGDYTVFLPEGLVQDEARVSSLGVLEGGGNSLAATMFTFATNTADVTVPLLLSRYPANEVAAPTFTLPTSSSILLTFTETVQAGVGSISLVGHSGSKQLSFPVTSAEVTFAGSQVVIAPEADLAPGEIYSVKLEASAVADAAGNEFAGLLVGEYKISTLPLIRFGRLGGSQFDTERYLVRATVDSSNNIYAVGGLNGTAVGGRRLAGTLSNATLTDVWRLNTRRATHCSSYVNTSMECSTSSCVGNPPTLGTWPFQRVVWRSPSMGGSRCVDALGVLIPQQVGDIIEHGIFTCPCPTCPPLPEPLPLNMVNDTYIDAYSQLPATGEARPMLCSNGYTASGNLHCRPSGSFSALWDTPYPSCKADPCLGPPMEVPFQDPRGSSATSSCALASLSSPVAHAVVCPMLCQPGYVPQGVGAGSGVFRCELGEYVLPVCEPRICEVMPSAINGKVTCPAMSVRVGLSCQIICNAGYRIVGNQTITCAANSSTPESHVRFTSVGTCVAQSCGEVTLKDPNGLVLSQSSDTTGSIAQVGCAEGYVASVGSIKEFACKPKFDAPEVGSAWFGSLSCSRVMCNHSEYNQIGFFTCEQAHYGDICQLECPVGYALQAGNGRYACSAAAQLVGSGLCREVPCPASGVNVTELVEFATGSDCPSSFNSSVQCSVTCKEGYSRRGNFACYYGGFSQVPACIPEGARADVMRFTLSSINVAFESSSTAQLAADQGFYENIKYAIADGLNQVLLYEVRIENVLALQNTNGLNMSRLWIAFKVRAKNDTAVSYWLSEEQALTKARLQSSLQARVPGMQISSMVLAPARLAIQYGSLSITVPVTQDQSFLDRLVSTDDSDNATVLLGCIVGIVFGLAGVALCCRRGGCAKFVHRRYEEDNEDNPNAPLRSLTGLSGMMQEGMMAPPSPSYGGGNGRAPGSPGALGPIPPSPSSKESGNKYGRSPSEGRERNPIAVVSRRLRQGRGQCIMQ